VKRLLGIVVLLAGLGVGASTLWGSSTATVDRIVDGDTIVVSGETVRLLEVDTPETKKPGTPVQCYGPEATAHMKQLLPPGTRVRLEDDREKEDRYKRHLAYVYRVDDGLFVNAELVKSGYAEVKIYSPNDRHERDLRPLETAARSEKLGRWGACP